MEEDEEFSPYLRSGTARSRIFFVVIFPREPIASVVSPRTKKELREDDEWGEGNKCNYVNGHSYGTFGNGITTNGAKKNGDYKRNGEVRSRQLFDTINTNYHHSFPQNSKVMIQMNSNFS